MIICIGNALVDALEQIDEEAVHTLNLNKARMTLVDKNRSSFLLSQMNKPSFEAGGSAANTAYWISKLGGSTGFIGRVSNDNLGKTFKESLEKAGLQDLTITEYEDIQTGLCAIFITILVLNRAINFKPPFHLQIFSFQYTFSSSNRNVGFNRIWGL